MYLIEVKLQSRTNLRPEPNTDNIAIATYPSGTVMQGNEIITLTGNLYIGSLLIGMKGDQWLRVMDVDGKPQTGYIALKHKGSTTGLPTIVRNDWEIPEPPAPDPVPTDDPVVKVILHYESGKVEELP